MSDALHSAGAHASGVRGWTLSSVVAVGAAVLLLLALGAFWPMYLAKPFATLDRYTHGHALAGATWLMLLLTQPLAIRARRLTLHRVLGKTAYVVGPAFVVSGVLLAHYRFAAMDPAKFAEEAYFLYLALCIAALFALAAGLGIRYRRNTSLHARFMASTALLLIDPIVARLLFQTLPTLPGLTTYQFVTFALIDAAFVALVLLFRPSATRPAPLWAFFAVMLAGQALWFTFALTPTWFNFAVWFRSLPLT